MNSPVRVRFAPSPTGHLHVGGARTALFNWLFARRHGGTFVLRIEDTDAERSLPVYTQAILDGLKWLGIDWDEGPEKGGAHGPYFQTQRLDLYRSFISKLVQEEKVYHCFCTPERLEAMRAGQAEAKTALKYDGACRGIPPEEAQKRVLAGEKHVLRLRMREGTEVAWNDLTKGPLSFASDLLDDLVVVKSDGMPTYNFAVVVDDVTMKITHVIRGEDHISNTPKQIMLYHALGEKIPEFAHIPMILGPDRSRLSKRHGATSVVEYREMGLEPAAFRNYLALLGWSPENGKEMLSREELFGLFALDRISSHGAIFAMEKLRWMNMEYIKAMPAADLLERVKPWLEKVPGFPGPYAGAELQAMVGLYRERLKSFDELPAQVEWFFQAPGEYDPKGLEKLRKLPDLPALAEALVQTISAIEDFTEAPLEQTLRAFAEERGRKAGDVIGICRLGLTGKTATPGLFELMTILKKPACVQRLQAFQHILAGEADAASHS
jgi:glutamyl-tRNA synthetase